MLEHKGLDKLANRMKCKGFSVNQAFINRLRILDIKIAHFGSASKPAEMSKNLIVNQTYEEMYRSSAKLDRNETMEEAKKRLERFETIYKGVTEFSEMSQEERKEYIEKQRPVLVQANLCIGKLKNDCRGHA